MTDHLQALRDDVEHVVSFDTEDEIHTFDAASIRIAKRMKAVLGLRAHPTECMSPNKGYVSLQDLDRALGLDPAEEALIRAYREGRLP